MTTQAKIDWNLVDYHNAKRFLEIMKAWNPAFCSQEAIDKQEAIVEECRAKLGAETLDACHKWIREYGKENGL